MIKHRRNISRINMYKTIYPFTKKYRIQFYLLFAIKLLSAIVSLLQVYFFKVLVDDIFIQKNDSVFWYLIVSYLVLFVIDTILDAFQLKLSNKVYNLLKLDLRLKVLEEILSLRIGDLNKFSISEIKMRINDDVEVIPQIISTQIIDFNICIIKIVSYFIILAKMSLLITPVISLSIPIFFLVTKKIKKKLEEIAEENRNVTSEYDEWLRNSLDGWKEVRTLNKYRSEEKKHNTIWKKLERNSNKQYVSWFINRAITVIKDFFIINVLLYFIGGILIINGDFTIGSMLIYINYFQMFFSAINELNGYQTIIHELVPKFQRVIPYLQNANDVVSRLNVNNFDKELQFENIKFSYNCNTGDVISNLSFAINKGDTILISGKSGVGKSTLIKILLRFYKPQSGDVLLDKVSVFDITDDSYYKLVGACLQDDYFFDATIRENLLIGKHSTSDAELINACRVARIHDDIMKMPHGYDTKLLSSAQNISGGQKQRLALARLILHNPQILILDESTVAIDNKTETDIIVSILKNFQTKTVIIISHNECFNKYIDKKLIIEKSE